VSSAIRIHRRFHLIATISPFAPKSVPFNDLARRVGRDAFAISDVVQR
jgi:hypothetical protein